MRAIIPIAKCDHCQDDIPVDTVTQNVTLVLDDGQTYVYTGENCSGCSEYLSEQLRTLLDEYLALESKRATPKTPKAKQSVAGTVGTQALTGVVPAPPSLPNIPATHLGDEKDRTCPVCGFVSKNRSALGMHLRKIHDTNLTEQGMSYTSGSKPKV